MADEAERCAAQIWPSGAVRWGACGSPVAGGRCLRYGHRAEPDRAAATRPDPGAQPLALGLSAEPLSNRELQVLDLLAAGFSAAATGRMLRISEHTVRHHLRRIYVALGARNSAHAVHVAWRLGVLGGRP